MIRIPNDSALAVVDDDAALLDAPTTSPRVLVATDTYPPQVNGVSVVTALSVAGLAARGWTCEVIAPAYPRDLTDPFDPTTERAGVPVTAVESLPLPFYPDIRLAAPRRRLIARIIDRGRPDLVHCATEFMIGQLAAAAARARGIPVVTSYHTDFTRYAAAYGLAWLMGPTQRYLGRFHGRAQRTYTPSSSARSDLLRLGLTDVEVWGRGVDTTLFSPGRRSEPLRQAYGNRDTFLLLHVGRLAAEKGVDRILDAYDLARRRLPERAVHLVIAGAGPVEKALRARATEGVTFLGNLDRLSVLPRLYASADAFLFASHTETLGLVILEAMASGLPVIAAPAGGVADHLRDQVNGIAYPAGDVPAMADAIVALTLDRERARSLGLGARRTAERLSWEHELDRLDVSYREVCASATSSAADSRNGRSAPSTSARRLSAANSSQVRIDQSDG